MRNVYFDEAGLANPEHEPYTVVAGVVIQVDEQYEAIRRYLLDMADDFVGGRPNNFAFHAKDLWHGEGFFPRPNPALTGPGMVWTLEQRLKILGHLADIPAKFDLPVIYSCIRRAPYLGELPLSRGARRGVIREANKRCHVICFMSCLEQTERWMIHAYDSEKVFIVVEHHDDHREKLLEFAQLLSNPRAADVIDADTKIGWRALRHLVDDPLFVRKSGASPIQIADVCAFILARALGECQHALPLLERIRPNLVSGFTKNFVTDHAVEARPA